MLKAIAPVLTLSVIPFLLAAPAHSQTPEQPEASLPACREQIAANPTSQAAARCFFLASRSGVSTASVLEALSEEVDRHTQATWLRYYYGRVLWWPNGIGTLAEAAARFAAEGDVAGEIRARTDLVTVLGFSEEFDASAAQLEAARQLLKPATAPGDRGIVVLAEAQHLILTGGDLERARLRLLSAHELLMEAGSAYDFDRLECLRSLLHVTLELGLQLQANRYAQQARRLAFDTGSIHYMLGTSYNAIWTRLRTELPDAERRQEVLSQLHETVELVIPAGYREAEARSRRLIAEIEGGPAAQTHLERCLELARTIQDTDLERRCLLSQASLFSEDEPRRARRLLNQAYSAGLANPGPWTLFHGWADHLRVLWATGPREEALAGGEVVLGAIETLRDAQVGLASDRLLSTWADAYYWLAGRLLDEAEGQEDLRAAFAIMERLRGQSLREVLEFGRPEEGSVPEDLLRQRREIESELVEAYRQLFDPRLNPEERRQGLERRDRLETQEAELRSEIATYAARARISRSNRPDLLDEVESRLAEDEALLSFQLGLWEGWDRRFLGGAWLLVSTRAGTRAHALDVDRAALEPWLKIFLSLPQPEGKPAERLYDELLASALTELPETIRKLIIVPDGALHLLPFSTLRPPDGPALAERYEIDVVPSANLWLHWRQRRGEAGDESGRSPAALALASPSLPDGASMTSLLGWPEGTAKEFGPLPYARKEGEKVVRHLAGESRLVAGPAASEVFLRDADLGSYDILHFAAHAVADSERPRRSAILLTAGGESEDGFLRPAEIADLDGLDGRLVVLSACDSATGDVLRGEGVLSLARAFFEAGAQTVVGSLWRLNDRAAAEFFDDFYRHLARGRSVSQATAATQREWIASGREASTWAAIVVLGDGDLVPVPGGVPRRPRWWLTAAGALLVVLLASLAIRRR